MIDWILSIDSKDWCLVAIIVVLFIVTVVDVLGAERAYRNAKATGTGGPQ